MKILLFVVAFVLAGCDADAQKLEAYKVAYRARPICEDVVSAKTMEPLRVAARALAKDPTNKLLEDDAYITALSIEDFHHCRVARNPK